MKQLLRYLMLVFYIFLLTGPILGLLRMAGSPDFLSQGMLHIVSLCFFLLVSARVYLLSGRPQKEKLVNSLLPQLGMSYTIATALFGIIGALLGTLLIVLVQNQVILLNLQEMFSLYFFTASLVASILLHVLALITWARIVQKSTRLSWL